MPSLLQSLPIGCGWAIVHAIESRCQFALLGWSAAFKCAEVPGFGFAQSSVQPFFIRG